MRSEQSCLEHKSSSSTPATPNQSTETDPIAAPKRTLDLVQVFSNLKKQQKPSTELPSPKSQDLSTLGTPTSEQDVSGGCPPHSDTNPTTNGGSEQVSRPTSLCSQSLSSIPGPLCRVAAACAAAHSRPFRMPVPCKHFDRLKEPDLQSTDSNSSYSSESSINLELTNNHNLNSTGFENELSKQTSSQRIKIPPPLCRICLCASNSKHERLLRPCNCRGPFTYAHQHCLAQWLKSSQNSFCDVCRFQFILERRPPPCSRFFKKSEIQYRLLSGFLAILAGIYLLITANLTVQVLEQRRLFPALVRWFLLFCNLLWAGLFFFIVCLMFVWQSIDFWHWRRINFDLIIQDNPTNLLRDQGVLPRNSIRTSGLRRRRKAAEIRAPPRILTSF